MKIGLPRHLYTSIGEFLMPQIILTKEKKNP